MHILVKFRLALAAVGVVSLAACGSLTGTGDPNVAATVNGTEVPVSAVEERFEQARSQPQVAQQLEADEDGAFESQVQAQILSQLVVSELLEQWADELGVEATDEEVQQQRDELIEQLGGEEQFDQAVSESGLTEEDVELQLRQQVLQEKIADTVAEDIEVTDEEVESFYQENAEARFGERATARHILVEDQALANRIVNQLEGGADFAELAQQHSTDQGSAAQGGELPEFSRGQMVPEFEEAVFSAQEGEVVGPVQTQYGYHVIEVTGRQSAQELGEVEDTIRTELTDTRQGELLQERLRERAQEADVTVNPRFGTWDPEAGEVKPDQPLGATSEAPGTPAPGTPAPGTPAPASPAPGGTEQPPVEGSTE